MTDDDKNQLEEIRVSVQRPDCRFGIRNRDAVTFLINQIDKRDEALRLIAAPKRADGTYNRCREACELLARKALGEE